jgi:hypothetical protein
MGNRVILGGLLVCLMLLAFEVALLAVSKNWLALALTLTVVGGVVVASYVMVRPSGNRRRPLR